MLEDIVPGDEKIIDLIPDHLIDRRIDILYEQIKK
jgi:hypothetical protein